MAIKKAVFKTNAHAHALVIRALLAGPCSAKELADESGLHYVTILQYMREMVRVGAAHIAAWDKDSRDRPAIKVFALGHGKEAKKPKISAAKRTANYRARKAKSDVATAVAGDPRQLPITFHQDNGSSLDNAILAVI